MAGKFLVGNSSGIATLPKNILVGDSNGIAKVPKAIFIGNSNNQAVKVWPTGGGGLPSGSTQLSYIQNNRYTSEQYINTGIKPNSLTTIFMTFRLLSRNYVTIFSLTDNPSQNLCSFYFYPDGGYTYGNFRIQFGNQIYTSSLFRFTNNEWSLQYNRKDGYFSLYNVTEQSSYIYTTLTNSFSSNDYTLKLLYPHATGYGNIANAIQIISCSIWSNRQNNDSKVREYIPARRDTDGIIGLYDLINQQFYPNSYNGSLAYNFYGA